MTLKCAVARFDFVVGEFAGAFTEGCDDAVKAGMPNGLLARYMQDDAGIHKVEWVCGLTRSMNTNGARRQWVSG